MESDQYDNVYTYWIVTVDENNECLACARMLPTTSKIGMYTCMINDAYRGLLHSIPSNILIEEPPINATVWEATRFTIRKGFGLKNSKQVQTYLISGAHEFARAHEIERFLGFMTLARYRMFGKLGYPVDVIGEALLIDEKKYAVGSMPVRETAAAVAM